MKNIVLFLIYSTSLLLIFSPSLILATSQPSLPSGVKYYLVINITNANTIYATPSNFQQLVYFDAETTCSLIQCAPHLNNTEFFFHNGTLIKSWYESANGLNNNVGSNNFASSTNVMIWVLLPPANFIPATGSNTIYLGFLTSNTNEFNAHGTTGEAPQLTCLNSNTAICDGTYGKYDNGNQIFNFYDNFEGNVLNQNWTVFGNADITVSNGLSVIPTSTTSGVYTNYIPQLNSTIETYLSQNSGAVNSWSLVCTGECFTGTYYTTFGTDGGFRIYTNTGGTATTGSMAANTFYTISGELFPSTLKMEVNYSSIGGSYNYAYVPSISNSLSLGVHSTAVTHFFQYVRDRTSPPGGDMPSINSKLNLLTNTSLTSNLALPFTLIAGQPIVFTSSWISGTPPFIVNYTLTNTITGDIIYSNITNVNSQQSNSLVWIPSNQFSGNTLEANVIVTDATGRIQNSTYIKTLTIFPNTELLSREISIANTQNNATPANFQQMININASSFNNYEATDLGNIRFFDGSTELDSWCESDCTSSSTNTIYWVKIPTGIPANSRIIINITMFDTSLEYDGIYSGEAPQLSSTYAKYDNGNYVFSNYWNFNGTTLPNGWDTLDTTNTIVDNGLTLLSAQNNKLSYGTVLNPQDFIAEAYGYFTGFTNSNKQTFGWQNVLHSGNDENWINDNGNPGYALTNYNGAAVNSKKMTTGSTTTYQVLSVWTTPLYSEAMINYKNLTTYNNSFTSNAEEYISAFQVGTTGYTDHYKWFRTRIIPPNGIMPSANLGQLKITNINISEPVIYPTKQQTISVNTSGGIAPYTYNITVTNSSGKIIFNNISSLVLENTYTASFSDKLIYGSGPFTINVVVTDSNTTIQTSKATKSYNQIPPLFNTWVAGDSATSLVTNIANLSEDGITSIIEEDNNMGVNIYAYVNYLNASNTIGGEYTSNGIKIVPFMYDFIWYINPFSVSSSASNVPIMYWAESGVQQVAGPIQNYGYSFPNNGVLKLGNDTVEYNGILVNAGNTIINGVTYNYSELTNTIISGSDSNVAAYTSILNSNALANAIVTIKSSNYQPNLYGFYVKDDTLGYSGKFFNEVDALRQMYSQLKKAFPNYPVIAAYGGSAVNTQDYGTNMTDIILTYIYPFTIQSNDIPVNSIRAMTYAKQQLKGIKQEIINITPLTNSQPIFVGGIQAFDKYVGGGHYFPNLTEMLNETKLYLQNNSDGIGSFVFNCKAPTSLCGINGFDGNTIQSQEIINAYKLTKQTFYGKITATQDTNGLINIIGSNTDLTLPGTLNATINGNTISLTASNATLAYGTENELTPGTYNVSVDNTYFLYPLQTTLTIQNPATTTSGGGTPAKQIINLNDNVTYAVASNIPVFYVNIINSSGISVKTYYQNQLPVEVTTLTSSSTSFSFVCSFEAGSKVYNYAYTVRGLGIGEQCGKNYTASPNGQYVVLYSSSNGTHTTIPTTTVYPTTTIPETMINSTYNVTSTPYNFTIHGFGNITLKSKIPVTIKLRILNVSNSTAPIPLNKTITAFNFTVSTLHNVILNQTLNITLTLKYNCSIPSNIVAPYMLEKNDTWVPITPFSINTDTCSITFSIPPDPVIALFQSVKPTTTLSTSLTTTITANSSIVTTTIQQTNISINGGILLIVGIIVLIIVITLIYLFLLKKH